MNRLAELLRELKNHVGETYNTLDKGSTGKNIRHDANALAKTLKSSFPMLEKDPQYVSTEDLINSGFGVMPLTFIGKGAKTWNPVAAKKAEMLLKRGVDPEKVWQRHMTGQMPDGALFQEIDDSGAKAGHGALGYKLNNPVEELNMSGLMKHPDLYQAYPELSNIAIGVDKGVGGSYSAVSPHDIEQIRIGIDAMPKTTALHELQHAIQEREGWARGGNPDRLGLPREEQFLQAKKAYEDSKFGSESGISSDDLYAELTGLSKNIKPKKTWDELTDREKLFWLESGRDRAYRRLTGEAQARATQERMGMDMEQRRANYPLKNNKLADVLLSDLIYKYGDNGKAMSVGLPETEFSKAHALAQKNAALPIEQGGLGLHPDNTAMERARALGFDVDNPVYHGTNQPIDEFKNVMLGESTRSSSASKHHWFTDSPQVANEYADYAARQLPSDYLNHQKQVDSIQRKLNQAENKGNWDLAEKYYNDLEALDRAAQEDSGQNIIKLLLKKSGKTTDFKNQSLIDATTGLSDIVGNKKFHTIKNIIDSPFDYKYESPIISTHFATTEPNRIRSLNAAFDPMQKNSANILASLLLGIGLAKDEK